MTFLDEMRAAAGLPFAGPRPDQVPGVVPQPPARRTTGPTPGPTARESPQERDRRDLAATLAEFTAPMRIAFHGAVAARRAAGENPAGLDWRAVVDVRRRFDPAGWIRSQS